MQTRPARFRAHTDAFFTTDPHSPLTPEQQQHFECLRYYPEDPALRFAVALDRDGVSQEPVELETTIGTTKPFIPAATAYLTIDGQPVSLTLYSEQGRGRYFLPFRDATAGSETYTLGRYLDPQETPNGQVIIDFNYAYNPYGAYNDRWECPIPPPESHVAVPIRAGEQALF